MIAPVVANEKASAQQGIPYGTCPVLIWILSVGAVSLEGATSRGDSPQHRSVGLRFGSERVGFLQIGI